MTTLSQGLDDSLTSKVTSESIRTAIAQALWHVDVHQLRNTENAFRGNLDSYFAYYSWQTNMFLRGDGLHVSVNSHRDVANIANDLLRGKLSREKVKLNLQGQSNIDEARFQASINLTARLLFMMSIGKAPHVIPGGTDLVWMDNSGPIKDFIAAQFSSTSLMSEEAIRLEKLFTAQNLDRIAGLKITWTDDISDHLRLFNFDTEVAIFHHASFLMIAKDAKIFPTGLAEETLKTLALLLPKMDDGSHKWFRKLAVEHRLDLSAHSLLPLQTRDRQIGKFKFWHDRLVILKQAFDECEPSTWKQWWFDTRKGLYRWPFLVAAAALVLTAFFGLVQSVEGALQVYKAYNPSP
ncbi:hypothetical protein BGZ63DRAFT_427871 [Mariannaea sp. PMI_226]|nr:hypothetical protein BGZ63DRAFT_427871 [Mariannaea sp. PMI_226]